MNTLHISLGLMVAGAVLYLLGRRQVRVTKVSASKNSIAVGGNNSGTITSSRPDDGGHGALTIISIVVELVAIALALYHILHKVG